MNEFSLNGKKISHTDQGQGIPVVLLHGYLETKEVWHDFANQLSKNYRVIIPDIPGHGESEMLDETHSMELMARSVYVLLKLLEIEKCVLVGHSMGGYVMLAFARLFPQKVTGLVLFHSSVYADMEEKKKNRLLEIDEIEKGSLNRVIAIHLPKTFALENLIRFQPVLEDLSQRALNHDPKGVCALIRGMMDRPDRQELIRNFNKPMLFIFGKKDNFISIEVAEKMVLLNPKIQLKWLSNSGHMGFIEEPDRVKELLDGFLEKMRYL